MISRTATVLEGEWFTDGTPDEWFAAHAESAARGHRDLTDEQRAMVRRLTETPTEGRFWIVRVDDFWHRLWTVGLYDGWVFWRPRLCLGTDGPIPGMHPHEGYNLSEIALGEPNTRPHGFYNWQFVDGTQWTGSDAEEAE
jgi:hypothetical protein